VDPTYTDELYEILDELNSRIENIVNEYTNLDVLDVIIPKIRKKSEEFIEDIEQEIEKLSIIEIEA